MIISLSFALLHGSIYSGYNIQAKLFDFWVREVSCNEQYVRWIRVYVFFYWSTCSFISFFIYLLIHRSIYLFAHLLLFYLFTYLFTYLHLYFLIYIYNYIHIIDCLFINSFIYSFIYLLVCLFICLFVYSFIYWLFCSTNRQYLKQWNYAYTIILILIIIMKFSNQYRWIQECHREFDRDFLYENRDKEREKGNNGKVSPTNLTILHKNSSFCISRLALFLFLLYRKFN